MTHLGPDILHPGKALVAPAPVSDLFAWATQRSKDAAEAERRAEEIRESLALAQATLEESQEWKDAEEAKASLAEAKEAALARDLEVAAMKEEVKKKRAALRKVKAYGIAKALKKDAATFDATADFHRRGLTRALAKGSVPTDLASKIGAATGLDVVVLPVKS